MPAVEPSESWCPGDRLICVRQDEGCELVLGRLYLLKSFCFEEEVELASFASPAPSCGRSYGSSLFRRLRPHDADLQDFHTIEMLHGLVAVDQPDEEAGLWDGPAMCLRRALFTKMEIRGA